MSVTRVARQSPGQGTKNVLEYSPAVIILKDIPGPNGVPLMNTTWRLLIGDQEIATGETDDSGRVNVLGVLKAGTTYTLEYPGRSLAFRKDALDGIGSVTGMQQRLSTLGYNPGPIDGQNGPRTRTSHGR